MFRHFLTNDAATLQRHQLLNLLFLFVVGKIYLNIPITWWETGAIVAFAVVLDHLLILARAGRLSFFSYSSVITAIGVIFLLRATEFEIYFIVTALAIVQKHWLKISGRHFLNPSNMAVVAGLMIFPYATYTTPEQWGGMWWLGVVMTVLGLIITFRAGRVLIPIVFSLSYIVLTYAFITRNQTEILFTLLSGSYLLFIYFMLTDPRTTPEQPGYQALFAAAIAVLTVFLELTFGARDITMFLALFIVSLLVPLIRIAQARSVQSWRYLLAAIAVPVAVVALSPLNYMNRLQVIAAIAPADAGPQQAAQQRQVANLPIDWGGYAQAYETGWQAPHLLATPYRPQQRDQGFARRAGALGQIVPQPERRHFGADYSYHAPIAAGDINHDGRLDLALGSLGRGLTLMINRGDGQFSDATAQLFEAVPPGNVDQVALVDMDSDSYLDLLVSFNPYDPGVERPNRLYRFDPAQRRFVLETVFDTPVRATVGGYALIDINHDRRLDLYISFDHDFQVEGRPIGPIARSDGEANQFWVSGPDGWQEAKTSYFPAPDEKHAGMTVMFTDLNRDGRPDFLLGNDMQPDLSYRMGEDGRFALIPKEEIEYNALASMGYMALDIDNDGAMEVWENCIAYDTLLRRTRYGEFIQQLVKEDRGGVFDDLIGGVSHTPQACGDDLSRTERNFCLERTLYRNAMRLGDRAMCDSIENIERRNLCRYKIGNPEFQLASPRAMKRDVETYPRKVAKNILLKRTEAGRYEDVLGDDGAALTGWSWAAYPYDLDNNGFQDLFVTTGMSIFRGREPAALLMNYSTAGKTSLINRAKLFGVDFDDDGRGVLAADLDGDGDGELVVNNLYNPPVFLDNKFGGASIKVELRSRRGNYFGLGSRVELQTDRGLQVREMAVGGIWDSKQPHVLHFGLDAGETIEKLTVRWPYGETTVFTGIQPDNRYVIYD